MLPAKGSKQGWGVAGDVEDRPGRKAYQRGTLGLTRFPLPRTLTQEEITENRSMLDELLLMVSRMTISFDHLGNIFLTFITS